ncbi:hypothetical protein BD309DRAFT_1025160 [Dichomitus squalens]|nr:hypothetical protein BD309DRAFT_1025160 [Dichomitus squalens]
MSPELVSKPGHLCRRVVNIDDGSESLAHQMGLTNSRQDLVMYFDIVNTAGTLCDKYLPPDPGIMSRYTAVKRKIIKKLLEKYPILGHYENNWPLKVMIQYHRQLRRNGSKTGIICSPTRILKATTVAARRKSDEKCHRILREDDTPGIPHQDGPSRDATPSIGRSDDVREPSPSLTAVDNPAESSAIPVPILDFLSALAQDLSFLLAVFISHGVGDDTSLQSMLQMNNWRSWMYTWVREGVLTELQFQMIVDGLEKLLRKP